MSHSRRSQIRNSPDFRHESKHLATALRAGAALALLAALTAPAGATSTGQPQELRPAPTAIPELNRPASIIRAAKPRTAAAPAATAPSIGTHVPAKVAAKPALVPSEQPAKPRGPLSIVVSIDHQHLTLYAGNEPIAQSRVSTGQKGFSTPTGVFSIIQKDRWHRSNLYEDAPMYFMQRITWSGVALHQGVVPNYPASHGCIRLPEAFAKQLWGTTQMGVRVIVTRGEPAPHEITHPKLFTPKAPATVASLPDSLQAAQQAWRIAQIGGDVPIAGATNTSIASLSPTEIAPQPHAKPLKSGPISVFISRKEGKLYVRKGFEPLFDTPIEIANPEMPFGTHVFTAVARNGEGLRWNVVSISSGKATPFVVPAADSVLDRIMIPQETIDRISELAGPGTSLIVSDQGLGSETGLGTDFIVLTR